MSRPKESDHIPFESSTHAIIHVLQTYGDTHHDTTAISVLLYTFGYSMTPSNIGSVLNKIHKKLGDGLISKIKVDRKCLYKLTRPALEIGADELYRYYYLGNNRYKEHKPMDDIKYNEQNPDFIKIMDENAERLEHSIKKEDSSEFTINLKILGKINFIFSFDKS